MTHTSLDLSRRSVVASVFLAATLSLPNRAIAQDDGAAAPTPPPTVPDEPLAAAPDAALETVGLAHVLEVAVTQKPSLAQAAIDVAIAEAAVLRALGVDDWVFDATGRWASTRLQAFGLDQDSITFDANLSRQLSTGGTVTLHADTGYTRATTDALSRTTYDHTISASLAQPLLRGRGKRVTHAERRSARIQRDAAALSLRMEAITTVRQVIGSYWQLAYAWRDLEIRQNSLALARERLRVTQAGIDAGAVAPTEALAVQQSIVGREEAIISAEQSIARLSLDLRRLAGLEIGLDAIDLRAAAPSAIPERTFDLHVLAEQALQSSPTFARLRALEKSAEIDVELTENGLLPELDLLVSFGPTGSADTPGAALGNMVSFDDLTFSASLTYRQTIGKRQARGTHERAQSQLRRQRVGIQDVTAQVQATLVLEVKRAEAARKRFDLGARAIELARQNIEAEKARFELGRATNFDVMQRQDELEQAQLRQASALIDFLDALAAIDALAGTILEQYGITLEPAAAP